jgi:integrase
MTVTEAHAKAIETLKLFNEGKNPNDIKRAEARGASPDGHMTLGEAFERYLAERKARGLLRETTVARLTSHYRNHLAEWGTRTLKELGQARLEVNDLHTKLTEKNGWAVANATIRLLSALYDRTAELEDGLLVNPCNSVLLNEDRVRNTALNQTDLRFWWAQAMRLSSPTKRAYWLTVALTGGRRTQMASSEWKEIDFESRTWTFPNEKAKAGNGYKIPLSSFTVEFLTEWRKYVEQKRPGCQFVFPGKFKGTSLKAPRNDKQGLSSQSHALRHTWETAGVSVELNDIEAHLLLGHSLKSLSMRGRYTTPGKVDWKTLAEKQEKMTAYLLKGLGVTAASIADIIWGKVRQGAWKIGQKTPAKNRLALVS